MVDADGNPFEDGPSPNDGMFNYARREIEAGRRKTQRKGEAEAETIGPVSILCLEVTGFKRLRAVRMEPNGTGLTVIGGDNAQGKTSVLDAVECLFGGARAIPEVPVHEGEREARIVAEVGAYRVRRIIRPDRTTNLEITRTDGTPVDRPQEFLRAMTGRLWFDPLEFIRQEPKQQSETLRQLVGLDFTGLDRERASLYDQRTAVGRDQARAKGHSESLPYHPDVPADELTASELTEEISRIGLRNQAIDEAQSKLRQAADWVRAAGAAVERIDDEIADLEGRLASARERREAAAAEHDKRQATFDEKAPQYEATAAEPKGDTSDVLRRLGEIEATNLRIRENRQRAQAIARVEELSAEYDGLTARIAGIDQEKARQLAAARMPVDGLSFDDAGGAVLYNGLPLAQASGAEQIRVAVAMAMAMSGNLKVALVDEGEKLDLASLKQLDETVRDFGGQVLLSRVTQGDEAAIIIEDGLVAGGAR